MKSTNIKKNHIFLKILFLISFSATLIFILIFARQNITPVIVSGTSMSPTLQEAEQVIILKENNIKNGDIVSFEAPDEENTYYIKRVIGIAGDTVEYKDDKLYINGKFIEEPYLDDLKNSERWKRNGNFAKLTQDFTLESLPATNTKKVPENMLFVMGDNRIDSKDSRYFGFISVDKVIGKMIYPKVNEKTGN